MENKIDVMLSHQRIKFIETHKAFCEYCFNCNKKKKIELTPHNSSDECIICEVRKFKGVI